MKTMKTLKIILAALLLVFLIIQFFPKNLPENTEIDSRDLIYGGYAEGEIAAILKRSCYDCHSNNVYYPWYSKIAPVSWLLAKDVTNGKASLNLSEWGDFSQFNKINRLVLIKDVVNDKSMPLPVYLIMHKDARLSDEQIELITVWADNLTGELQD